MTHATRYRFVPWVVLIRRVSSFNGGVNFIKAVMVGLTIASLISYAFLFLLIWLFT